MKQQKYRNKLLLEIIHPQILLTFKEFNPAWDPSYSFQNFTKNPLLIVV
eukprot:UN25149